MNLMNHPLMRSLVLRLSHRIENPVFGMGACAGGIMGVYTGMIDGLSEARQEDDGYLWRPVMGICGRSMLFAVVGLFWPECLTMAVGIDMFRSLRASESRRTMRILKEEDEQ